MIVKRLSGEEISKFEIVSEMNARNYYIQHAPPPPIHEEPLTRDIAIQIALDITISRRLSRDKRTATRPFRCPVAEGCNIGLWMEYIAKQAAGLANDIYTGSAIPRVPGVHDLPNYVAIHGAIGNITMHEMLSELRKRGYYMTWPPPIPPDEEEHHPPVIHPPVPPPVLPVLSRDMAIRIAIDKSIENRGSGFPRTPSRPYSCPYSDPCVIGGIFDLIKGEATFLANGYLRKQFRLPAWANMPVFDVEPGVMQVRQDEIGYMLNERNYYKALAPPPPDEEEEPPDEEEEPPDEGEEPPDEEEEPPDEGEEPPPWPWPDDEEEEHPPVPPPIPPDEEEHHPPPPVPPPVPPGDNMLLWVLLAAGAVALAYSEEEEPEIEEEEPEIEEEEPESEEV